MSLVASHKPRFRLLPAAAVVGLLFAGGCSSDNKATEPAETTVADDGFCPPSMPGEIMSADEAVVKFSPTQVCPGYVTVVPGTEVTFNNLDTKPADVTVYAGPGDDADEVWTANLGPGKSESTSFDDPTVLYYVVSSIESFRGTIEIKAA